MRITKDPDVRKKEITDTAKKLFFKHGYENVSVQDIVDKISVAKGTFYHYFESKEDLLEEIVTTKLDRIMSEVKEVATNQNLSPIQKLETIFVMNKDADTKNVKNALHHSKNRKLHELTNIQIVLRLSPIISKIVEEGVECGIFKLDNILETVQLLLAGSQFLFDGNSFDWNLEQTKSRRIAMQQVFEKSLGTEKGTFNFFVN